MYHVPVNFLGSHVDTFMFLLCFYPIETLNILLKLHFSNFGELSETLPMSVKLYLPNFSHLSKNELFFGLFRHLS